MKTTRQYDRLNRLTSVASAPSGANQFPVGFAYQYNDANQRVRATLADGSFWVYEYDRLGQVVSGKRYWIDGTPVPGQQYEYGFDDIGNRGSAKSGGNASGTGLRSAVYTNNTLNQLTGRGVPGEFDVMGIAHAGASVTVNSSAADYRRDEYFQEAVSVANTTSPVWQNVAVTASQGGSSSNWPAGSVFVPRTGELFGHDTDGNLTSDGRWAYTWDGENRLVRHGNGVRSILLMFGRTLATPLESPPPPSCFVTLPSHTLHTPRHPPAGTGPVNRRRNRLTNCCLLGTAAKAC